MFLTKGQHHAKRPQIMKIARQSDSKGGGRALRQARDSSVEILIRKSLVKYISEYFLAHPKHFRTLLEVKNHHWYRPNIVNIQLYISRRGKLNV